MIRVFALVVAIAMLSSPSFADAPEKLDQEDFAMIRVAQLEKEKADLSFQNMILQIRVKHGLKVSDGWDKDGTITHAKPPEVKAAAPKPKK